MYYVYVLYSRQYEKLYIGYTSNLEVRLRSHSELGKKGWTIRYRPWELLYKESYATKDAAMQGEEILKGVNWLIAMLLYLIVMNSLAFYVFFDSTHK